MNFKQGEYVKIIEREQTPADVKSGMYYPFFSNLAGTVDRVYEESVSVKIDQDTLPASVLKRHQEMQESVKQKWLNGLSGEARNRLTPEEKKFQLAYTLLVQITDLEKAKAPAPKPIEPKKEKPVDPVSDVLYSSEPEPTEPETADDLTAAERAFLREREEALKNQ